MNLTPITEQDINRARRAYEIALENISGTTLEHRTHDRTEAWDQLYYLGSVHAKLAAKALPKRLAALARIDAALAGILAPLVTVALEKAAIVLDLKARQVSVKNEIVATKAAKKLAAQVEVDNHPVKAAVAPLREQAVASAATYAQETIAKVHAALAAGGWDLNVVAPYPRSDIGRGSYNVALGKHNLYSRLTNGTQSCRSFRDADIRVASPEAEARFIAAAKENAAAEFDSFVAKLAAKIGPCASAALRGSSVWQYSFIDVVLASGEKQTWKTQQILNCSGLGTVYNQWPTRLVK